MKTSIKTYSIIILLLTQTIISFSQSWFQGGNGSGFNLNTVSLCSAIDSTLFRSSIGSGFDFNSFSTCTNNQSTIFTSSSLNSGADFSENPYCSSTTDNSIAFRGQTGSGAFFKFEPCLITLPIELLSFEAIPNENDVVLVWTTASEINNDFFTIQRSSDVEVWEDIAEIEGAGNSNEIIHYEDIDYEPLSGTSYYRLKQTDFDGYYSYSSIQVVFFGKNVNNSQIIAFPNPTKGIISFSGIIESFNITDIMGRDISYQFSILDKTRNLVKLDLSNLPPGIYVFRANNNASCKFVVE